MQPPHQHAPTALASFICRLSSKHRAFRFSDLRAHKGRDAQSVAGQVQELFLFPTK
jgi:hypothetical protein